MKFTNDSRKLINFFTNNNCLKLIKQTNKTDLIFKKLYYEITNSVSYINNLKAQLGDHFYKLKIEHITNVKQIPKPSTFPANGFPNIIRNQINEYSLSSLSYSFQLFNRNIKIIFLTEDLSPEEIIKKYNNYVDFMLVWLHIAFKYSSHICANELKIFIYHTSLNKRLPQTNIEILDESNVNTAFTRSCPKDSEIVVFRKEEWFKVFIHETFHNFGLDFSGMNNGICHSKILSIFPVKSDVNLYEAYTEFWARIINVLFCSFIKMKDKKDINDFLTNTELLMNFERIYSFFQMVKVLDFMDLSYINLYENSSYSENMRNNLYKENTSVLSYYIITLILINNYQGFLLWCQTNNKNLFQFEKTSSNQQKFCDYIEKKYKSKNLLDGIECTEKLLHNLKKTHRGKRMNELGYILTNLRMTICELG